MAVGAAPSQIRETLARVAQQSQPVALAREQLLPVLPVFEALLPEPGLRRGTVTQVQGPAATSLALALLAGCSATGSWLAAIGVPGLGLAAAGELGVALEHLFLVDVPSTNAWATAVAAALDGVDALLVEVPRQTRAADARRLEARLRERGAVLVVLGSARSFQPDLVVAGNMPVWHGLGSGWGHLHARCVPVEVTGRRAAARPRTARLWLPDPEGEVRLEQPEANPHNVVALHPMGEAG